MANLDPDDLRSILSEQQELRLRLVALDRKIETLRTESLRPLPNPRPPIVPEVDFQPEPPAAPAPSAPSVPDDPAPEPSVSTIFDVSPRLTGEASGIPVPPIPPVAAPVGEENDPTPPAAPSKGSLELQLGTVWLVRIGIVMLLTGLVFLGNHAYRHFIVQMGPWGKIGLLTLAGALLGALGARLERRSLDLRNYGRVLLAGGAATLYYTAYAATFVDRLRVIHSHIVGGGILLVLAAGVVWLAEKRRSQTVALTAVLLAYYTSAINPVGGFTLFSNLLLTSAAVYFLLRHRWTTLSFLSLAGTYGSFAFWRFYRTGQLLHASGPENSSIWVGIFFLAGYWVLFTAAVFLSRAEQFPPARRTPFLTLNNAAFFGLTAPTMLAYPGFFGRFCLGYGALLLLLAWLAARREAGDRFQDSAYLVQGLGVLTLGLAVELAGYHLALALAVQSAVLLAGMHGRHGSIREVAGALAAGAATVILLQTHDPLPNGGAIRWIVAGIMLFNAWLYKFLDRTGAQPVFHWRSAVCGGLALVLAVPLIGPSVPLAWMETALIAAGLVLVFLLPKIRLQETAILSQGLVLLGVAGWMFSAHPELAQVRTMLTCLAGPLALVHWWQRRRPAESALATADLGQGLFALVTLAVAVRWIVAVLPDDSALAALGALAVVTLIYGTLTRAWWLAWFGQIPMIIAAAWFAIEAILHHPSWFCPTLALGCVIAQAVLLARLPGNAPDFLPGVRKFCRIANGVTLALMIATWAGEYVPAPFRMLFFTVLSGLLLVLAWRWIGTDPAATRNLVISSVVSALAAWVIFLVLQKAGTGPHWPNFLALGGFVLLQQLARRWSADRIVPGQWQHALLAAVVAGFWLEINRVIDSSGSGFPKTVAWALLAAAALGTGLILRERACRLAGLILLALAVIRIMAVDVWQLDTIYRIVSFLVLGALLLGIGFVYNKYAGKLREWL